MMSRGEMSKVFFWSERNNEHIYLHMHSIS